MTKKSISAIVLIVVVTILCSCSKSDSIDSQLTSEKSSSFDGPTREEQWSEDIEILSSSLKSIHKGLYDNISEEKFNSEMEFLKSNISNLDDQEMTIKIMKLIAGIGDGHTYVMYLDFLGESVLPIKFAWKNEKLLCVNATPRYSNMLHSEIVSINGKPVDEIFTELMSLASGENDYRRTYIALGLVRLPSVYEYLKQTANGDSINFTYKKKDVEETMLVDSVLYKEDQESKYILDNRINSITSPLDSLLENPYSYEYDEDNKIMVLRYDQCFDYDSTFREFNLEFWKAVEQNEVEKIVVDLRYNSGGDSELFNPFRIMLNRNKEFDNPDKLYVLIGNRTFSSANMTAIKMEKLTNATLIGEPTGNAPNHYSDPHGRNYITLPNSGIRFRCTDTFFELYPDYKYSYLMPDKLVKVKIDDYVTGTDSCYEYILEQGIKQ
ncbi:hypothetical protein [Fusibacter sp. JL216-2]|uniref:hypothetical protein n=1 Tax=Fusibacter sp. JL216-2 TaxID=3071453 RepID=UPI003D34CDC0